MRTFGLMQRISLDINTNLYEILKMIQESADYDIVLEMPQGFLLFENGLNLKIIQEKAKKWNKNLRFATNDIFGANLIKMLNDSNFGTTGFGSEQIKDESIKISQQEPKFSKSRFFKGKILSVFGLVKLSLGKLFKFKKSKKLLFLPAVFVVVLCGVAFFYLQNTSKAKVVIFFDKEVLTKSAQIKVGENIKTDPKEKTLLGIKVSKNIESTLDVSTTGTKLKGEKAEGKVTFYNSTQSEIVLEKGTQITAKEKDKNLVFVLNEKVVVPARTDTPPPDTTIIKGTAQGEVTALDIGDVYNLKKDTEFSVKGYKKSDLVGLSSEDFKGGFSKQVAVVSSLDVNKLEKELSFLVSSSSKEQLKNLAPAGYVLIPDSVEVKNKKITLNANVGDEKEKLSGSIAAQVDGLAYSKSELEELIVEISKGLVPPGFEFLSFSEDIEVEVLGNTSGSVLNSSQADLQVTFRFFIFPKIDKDQIFQGVAGKSVEEAQKFIESINGVNKAQVILHNKLPIFNKIPKKDSLVEIEIKVAD